MKFLWDNVPEAWLYGEKHETNINVTIYQTFISSWKLQKCLKAQLMQQI